MKKKILGKPINVEFENSSSLSPVCNIVMLMEYPITRPLRSSGGGASQVNTAEVEDILVVLSILGALLGTVISTQVVIKSVNIIKLEHTILWHCDIYFHTVWPLCNGDSSNYTVISIEWVQ